MTRTAKPADVTTEYELKFRASVNELGRLRDAVHAVATDAGQWRTDHLLSRYFDTPDDRLAGRGVTVRLRRKNGRITQTVKAADRGAGGLMSRLEWECSIDDDVPQLSVLPKAARSAVGRVAGGALHPVVVVDVQRQSTTIRRRDPIDGDVSVEVAIDQGTVSAGGQSERFAECEFELVNGGLSGFFGLAAAIHAECPMPLSNTSKALRGRLLSTGRGPEARKSPKLQFNRDMTVHQALGEIFATSLDSIVANTEACLAGRDPEAVHQVRVSIRRLRSSLRAFRDGLEPERLRWIEDELSWLGRHLGAVRDWDVFVEETLAPETCPDLEPLQHDALLQAAMSRRREAHAQCRKILNSERFSRSMLRLTEFTALQAWLPQSSESASFLRRPLTAIAGAALRRPYRKLVATGRTAVDGDAEARHALRIRVKKLRYPVDFLCGVYPGKQVDQFARALHRLQSRLGRYNDIAQAIRLVDGMADHGAAAADPVLRRATAAFRDWGLREMQASDPALVARWSRFAAMRPFWKKPARV